MSARDELYELLGGVPTPAVIRDVKLDAYQAAVLREGAALVEDKACDADFTEDPRYIAGLRTAAELLTRAAVEKATAAAATGTPFFELGHTYTREHHGGTIRFLVEHVSTSPDGRYRVAHGWRTRSWEPGWEPSDSDDFTIWADVTKGGETR